MEDHCRLRRPPAAGSEAPGARPQVKKSCPRAPAAASKSQLSSFILFASVIILINLCPFQGDLQPARPTPKPQDDATTTQLRLHLAHNHHRLSPPTHKTTANLGAKRYLTYLDTCLEFVKLLFRQPLRLQRRTTRFTLAEARVLGKMAKVWYIKKKIKKLSKKLKKHTIAVPVFTAIPIYEHSYYPQPHVTHVSHGGHHAAAASSYAPAAVAQLAASSLAATAAGQQQQLATSASNQHQVAYRMGPPHPARGANAAMYHPAASHHHIINAYAPSPPLYVDDNGGLYGHYGNAYGRYDGGYHVW